MRARLLPQPSQAEHACRACLVFSHTPTRAAQDQKRLRKFFPKRPMEHKPTVPEGIPHTPGTCAIAEPEPETEVAREEMEREMSRLTAQLAVLDMVGTAESEAALPVVDPRTPPRRRVRRSAAGDAEEEEVDVAILLAFYGLRWPAHWHVEKMLLILRFYQQKAAKRNARAPEGAPCRARYM